ncbi:MAG: M20/M25/M40 family metallo-hydrolase, partial [Acidimicrobiia bacterium]|nr:M20/M25/M40 family metallo-hydrolase [Acidimicrobiia bacterium]
SVHIAVAHNCSAGVAVKRGYPVTVNDAAFVAFTRDVLGQLVGADRVLDMKTPILGAEDWAYVLAKVPGCMAFLGVCPPGVSPREAASCHSNRMELDEEALAVGIASHAAVALSFLS